MSEPLAKTKYQLIAIEEGYRLEFSGSWRFADGIPEAAPLLKELSNSTSPCQLHFDSRQLEHWDTGFMTFLLGLLARCQEHQIQVDQSLLPRTGKQRCYGQKP